MDQRCLQAKWLNKKGGCCRNFKQDYGNKAKWRQWKWETLDRFKRYLESKTNKNVLTGQTYQGEGVNKDHSYSPGFSNQKDNGVIH